MNERFKRMHLCVTKICLLEEIRLLGAKKVFKDFKGTDEEAIEWVRSQPGDTIVMGDCDRQRDGHCLGHPYEKCGNCSGTGKVTCLKCGGKGEFDIKYGED